MRRSALRLVPFLVFAFASRPASADEPPAPGAPEPAAALRDALQALAQQPKAAFEGSVKRKESAIGSLMGMSRGLMGMGGGDPFQGDFETYEWEGKTIVASKRATPGFTLYHDGRNSLVRTVFRSDAPDVSQVKAEVPRLVDRANLARVLSAAKWTAEAGSEGATTLKAKITEPLLPQAANPLAALSGLEEKGEAPGIDAEVDLLPDGKIREIRLRVPREDTAKALLLMGQKMGVGGAPPGALPGGNDPADQPETRYTLRPAGDAPSERLKTAITEMQALAGRP